MEKYTRDNCLWGILILNESSNIVLDFLCVAFDYVLMYAFEQAYNFLFAYVTKNLRSERFSNAYKQW